MSQLLYMQYMYIPEGADLLTAWYVLAEVFTLQCMVCICMIDLLHNTMITINGPS